MIHTVKGFAIVNKAEIDVFLFFFFLELSCFFSDPADVGNVISGSSDFPKTSLNIWKFTVHVLLYNSTAFKYKFNISSQLKRQKFVNAYHVPLRKMSWTLLDAYKE